MTEFWQIIALMGFGVTVSVICFLFGAFVMFRGKAAPHEGFLREPKGEAYVIPEVGEAVDFPGAEQDRAENNILQNTERFLRTLGRK